MSNQNFIQRGDFCDKRT